MTDKSTDKPSQEPKTAISQLLTNAATIIQAKVNFGAIALKQGARVPELHIQETEREQAKIYPLLGDQYLAGRSSTSCDIVIRNREVSKVHFSLKRDNYNRKSFIIADENSTNGIYKGKHRLESLSLRHGDVITLGPPELETAIEIRYSNPAPLWMRAIRYSLYGTGGIFGLLVLWLGIEWMKVPVRPLPTGFSGPVTVYARDRNTLLNPRSSGTHRELEKLSDFSPYLPKALLASEDARYYWHLGVDPIGILRALTVNYQKQGISQGASTITQQVARSLFTQVGRENTVGRKLREIAVAIKLEAYYSKDEILKTYLNRVYMGVGNYGFEDAAQFYFEKSAADLTISEAATLVAMLPAPNLYNPAHDYEKSVEQRNIVIARMAKLGVITPEEAARARRSVIQVSPKASQILASTVAPYFYSYIFTELRALLGNDLAKEGNFIVETSLDPDIQKKAETSLRASVNSDGIRYGFSQGAIVTLDTRSGEILALVGGVDYQQSQFNRAIQAQRQPGSTFKVFAYASAIEQGISPYKTYSCAGLVWKVVRYRPCERSSGNINMYRALAQSENSVALRIARDAGLKNVVEMAQRLGIRSPLEAIPGLVIGQKEVNVLEITGSYAAFANDGIWNRPHSIRRILDSSDCTDYDRPQTCRVIYSADKNANFHKQAISKRVANTMTDLLQGVVRNGTGRRAYLGLGEAGKTGTTDKDVDLWFIGYIPQRHVVTGIWLGNDNNSPTRGGSFNAATLWNKYMKKVTDPAIDNTQIN